MDGAWGRDLLELSFVFPSAFYCLTFCVINNKLYHVNPSRPRLGILNLRRVRGQWNLLKKIVGFFFLGRLGLVWVVS